MLRLMRLLRLLRLRLLLLLLLLLLKLLKLLRWRRCARWLHAEHLLQQQVRRIVLLSPLQLSLCRGRWLRC